MAKKRLLKKIILRGDIGEYTSKWQIKYWLSDHEDNGSEIITEINTLYLLPQQLKNGIKDTTIIKEFKGQVLLSKTIVLPESVFNFINTMTPGQLEVIDIMSKGGIRMVKHNTRK